MYTLQPIINNCWGISQISAYQDGKVSYLICPLAFWSCQYLVFNYLKVQYLFKLWLPFINIQYSYIKYQQSILQWQLNITWKKSKTWKGQNKLLCWNVCYLTADFFKLPHKTHCYFNAEWGLQITIGKSSTHMGYLDSTIPFD